MAQRMFMHWWECSARYESDFGEVIQRDIDGRWVLTDAKGKVVDTDSSRDDLAQRNNIELGQMYSSY